MVLNIVVHPRFGDTARVATEATGRPQLVADVDTGGTFSVQVDDEPGSTELAAQFARELAAAALRFAQRCAELMPGPVVAAPAASGDSGASNGTWPGSVVGEGGVNRSEHETTPEPRFASE